MHNAFKNADVMLDEGVLTKFGEPERRFSVGQAAGVVRSLNRRSRALGLRCLLFLRHFVLTHCSNC